MIKRIKRSGDYNTARIKIKSQTCYIYQFGPPPRPAQGPPYSLCPPLCRQRKLRSALRQQKLRSTLKPTPGKKTKVPPKVPPTGEENQGPPQFTPPHTPPTLPLKQAQKTTEPSRHQSPPQRMQQGQTGKQGNPRLFEVSKNQAQQTTEPSRHQPPAPVNPTGTNGQPRKPQSF